MTLSKQRQLKALRLLQKIVTYGQSPGGYGQSPGRMWYFALTHEKIFGPYRDISEAKRAAYATVLKESTD